MQSQNTTKTSAVALYARVSTDEQAERGSIQDQRDFLRRYAELHGLTVCDLYEDDGVSGAISLGERPDGRRLLADAEAGRFNRVIVYRLDRLGRSLKALIEAHDQLEAIGVTIASGTEPFDTSTAIGRMIFQFLGSIAEYERSTISERTSNGRARIARESKYTGGVIPFGYDVDAKRMLVPSERVVGTVSMTEAQIVTDLYQRIVAGSSLAAESRRLDGFGITSPRRYGTGKEAEKPAAWSVAMLSKLIRNPIYRGEHRVKAQGQVIARPMPALVDAATWAAAQTALTRNRNLSKKGGAYDYLLRGLMTCGTCGYAFHGQTTHNKDGNSYPRYRCGAYNAPLQVRRCHAKIIPAAQLEPFVWEGCREFILNPGEALAGAQAALRARMEKAATHDAERRSLLDQLAANDAEKDQIIKLYKRGKISDAEADAQLDDTAKEGARLREDLERLKAQERLLLAAEEHLTGIASMLSRLGTNLGAIEAANDVKAKAEIIRALVREIVVETRIDGAHKSADVRVCYSFDPTEALVLPIPSTVQDWRIEIERVLAVA